VNSIERAPDSRGEVDRFWDGAGGYFLQLLVADVIQALWRVWGHFTVLGFLNKAAQGLVVILLAFPLLVALKGLFGTRRDREES
jgi:hypothetical protein